MGGFAKVDNVFLRLGGFAKVDNRFVYEKWVTRREHRVMINL